MANGWQRISLSNAEGESGFRWKIDGNTVTVEGPKGISKTQTLLSPESGIVTPVVGTLVEEIKKELQDNLKTSHAVDASFDTEEPRIVTAEGSL